MFSRFCARMIIRMERRHVNVALQPYHGIKGFMVCLGTSRNVNISQEVPKDNYNNVWFRGMKPITVGNSVVHNHDFKILHL